MFVVVVGDPWNEGMEIRGPFTTHELALEYANFMDSGWWIVRLLKPGEEA